MSSDSAAWCGISLRCCAANSRRSADDFLAHVRAQGPGWDLDEATSFLVIAATLLDLKAARLLPDRDAAIVVYERLRTAQSICQALVPGAYSETAVFALLEAINDEVALHTPVE